MRYLSLLIAIVILLMAFTGCDPDNNVEGPIVTPEGNILWVVNYEDSGTVTVLNDNGEQYYTLDGFTRPRAIDCYAQDGSV